MKRSQPPNGIVIVGGGLAGLFAALKLSPLPVTVVSATPLGHGASSGWAQGGIAAAMEQGDHWRTHARDTIRVGAGLVDRNVAELVTFEAADRVHDLIEYGVPFDKDLQGQLRLSREAAHSARRIVRVKGDSAGKAIMSALTAAVCATPSIQVLEGYRAQKLVTESRRVTCIYCRPEGDHTSEKPDPPIVVRAAAVILAAGGVGGLFSRTTNPPGANGEALAMAANAGAVIADAEFVQFHPTAIDTGADPSPLATEALRGEGAVLVNGQGRRFMKALHKDAEMAPRDIVARAVFREKSSGRGAFLDCRQAIGAKFAEKFPTVYAKCREAGIDPVTEPIPVAPAAHFHMGGIATDINGRTTLDGLWACGEVAATGLHGANRLASNSLLEAVVFADRVACDLKSNMIPGHDLAHAEIVPVKYKSGETKCDLEKQEAATVALRRIMSEGLGVERNATGIMSALRAMADLAAADHADRDLTFQNMLTAAKIISAGALGREESRGGHFRSDYPQSRKSFRKRTFMTLAGADRIVRHALAAGPAGTGDENIVKFG